MAQLSREEFLVRILPLSEDIKEVKSLLREQNGRLRTAESDIARLDERSHGMNKIKYRAAPYLGGSAVILLLVQIIYELVKNG